MPNKHSATALDHLPQGGNRRSEEVSSASRDDPVALGLDSGLEFLTVFLTAQGTSAFTALARIRVLPHDEIMTARILFRGLPFVHPILGQKLELIKDRCLVAHKQETTVSLLRINFRVVVIFKHTAERNSAPQDTALQGIDAVPLVGGNITGIDFPDVGGMRTNKAVAITRSQRKRIWGNSSLRIKRDPAAGLVKSKRRKRAEKGTDLFLV